MLTRPQIVIGDLNERFPSYDMFGYKVTPMTVQEQLQLIASNVEIRRQCVISPLNLHGLYKLKSEPAMVRLHQDSKTYVVIDGMPIIGLCRLAGIGVTRQHRVTNLDLVWPLLSLADKKQWRVYYLGSTEDVLARGVLAIHARFPSLNIRTHHGYVERDSSEAIADIQRFRPDLLMVGMGTGLQERWIYMNMERLSPSSVMPVGALIEYLAGAVKTPPRWMGRAGLEWLFRLMENPARFWRRYLIEPWPVAWTLIDRMAQRRRACLDNSIVGVADNDVGQTARCRDI